MQTIKITITRPSNAHVHIKERQAKGEDVSSKLKKLLYQAAQKINIAERSKS